MYTYFLTAIGLKPTFHDGQCPEYCVLPQLRMNVDAVLICNGQRGSTVFRNTMACSIS